VVQTFPDPESVIRLVGALLCEANGEPVTGPGSCTAEATLAPLVDDKEDRLPLLSAIMA
jgi:hypothetical protein